MRNGLWVMVGAGVLSAGLFAGCGSRAATDPLTPVTQPTTGFFLIEPPETMVWSRAEAVSTDGLTLVGVGGPDANGSTAVAMFRWAPGENSVAPINWFPAPNVELQEPLGIADLTVSSNGRTVVGDVFHQGGPAFFVWTKNAGAAHELVRVPVAPVHLRSGASDDGSTVFISSPDESYAKHSDGALKPLGKLDGDAGAQAWGISADGRVITGNSLVDPRTAAEYDDVTRVFRWTEARGIEALALPAGATSCRTTGDMSASGDAIFGFCQGLTTQFVRWTVSGVEVLSDGLNPGQFEVNAVSTDGSEVLLTARPQVIPPETGSVAAPATDHGLVRWTAAEGLRKLALPPETKGCQARVTRSTVRIGQSGSVVAVCTQAEGVVATKWTSSGDAVLLSPPSGFPESLASSVSDDGQIVAGSGRRLSSPTQETTVAVVWPANETAAQPVEDLLRSRFGALDLKGATLLDAEVSSDGKTLWGRAQNADGHKIAWVARLP